MEKQGKKQNKTGKTKNQKKKTRGKQGVLPVLVRRIRGILGSLLFEAEVAGEGAENVAT